MGDVERLSTLLLNSATRCRLYGAEHRLTLASLRELSDELRETLREEDTVRLAISGDQVLYGERRLDASSGPLYGLYRRFSAKGIGVLELRPTVTDEELLSFCRELGDAQGTSIRSHPGLRLGTATLPEVSLAAIPENLRVQDLSGERDDPVSEEAELLVELSRYLREHYVVRTRDFNEIVLSLLSHLTSQDNLFLNLAEVREHNLFTYLHTCNVATLTMGFALALGMTAEATYELGSAALLHDVGKSFVPKEILDKPSRLEAHEWAQVQRHPVEGARLLLGQPGVGRLAVTVAYEHHMHFDGTGGYPVSSFQPSIQSQIVAVADTFDALFGKRSYHAKYNVLGALEILHSDAGAIYNPGLVDAFDRYINQNLETFDLPEEAPPG